MMNILVMLKDWFLLLSLCIALLALVSCSGTEDPAPEQVSETITTTVLTFKPDDGGSILTYEANDPDGEGPESIEVDDIILNANTNYTLTIGLYNGLVSVQDEGYDITEEVKQEGDEHRLFFEWSPAALFDGNFIYNDKDKNDQPIGLSTAWKTGSSGQSGTFRVVLKHQPNIKSATSGMEDGESDLDVPFKINIK